MASRIPDRPVYTTRDIAKLLRVKPITVRRWSQRGVLDAMVLPNGEYRIRRADLEAFLANADMVEEEEVDSG